MSIIFDVDGTLVNSRPAVKKAYEMAGVIMPKEAWNLPWQDWLFKQFHGNKIAAVMAHAEKCKHYLKCLKMVGELLPPAELVLDINKKVGVLVNENIYLYTSASKDAVYDIIDFTSIDITILRYNCTKDEKIKVVIAQVKKDFLLKQETIVIDDDEDIYNKLTDYKYMRPEYFNIHPILYTNQNKEELLKEIKEIKKQARKDFQL